MDHSRRSFLKLSTAAIVGYSVARAAAETDSPLCRELASDPLRPQYHLLPSHNWMNDPNGPIYFQGRYHMFHQYNPQGAIWGNMNWAHATSPDMIHWTHEPIAISPTPGGPDQDGVFSGSAVLDNGKPTVIYTGVAPPDSPQAATLRDGRHTWRETQCLAVAEDGDLRKWTKVAKPVIDAPPKDLQVSGFRDPVMWREGDRWMLILGSGTLAKGGMVLLYESTDLRNWTYLHPLVEGTPSHKESENPVDTGDMWECPDFFPLGNKHVLLISTMGKVRWKVGTYADRRFIPEKEGVVDWGSYYAAKTFLDRDGNRILWGWIPETRSDADLIIAGWAGVMSLPRIVSLNSSGELQTEVAPAAQQLRLHAVQLTSSDKNWKRMMESIRIRDLAAEIEIRLQPKSNEFAIKLIDDNGEPFVTISSAENDSSRELLVNRIVAPLPSATGSEIHLRMLLDGSVLEVFANGTTSLTARIYEIPSGPLHLKFEGDPSVASLKVWQMTPISKNRLTSPFCP